MYLRIIGFRRSTTSQGVSYWHRPALKDATKDDLPLVFFHGIGPGLWIYFPILKHLSGNRACLYVELRHANTTLSLTVPHWTTMIKAVEEMTDRQGIDEYCAAGHSFGSVVAGWVAREMPHRVKQLVLLDPICLLLW